MPGKKKKARKSSARGTSTRRKTRPKKQAKRGPARTRAARKKPARRPPAARKKVTRKNVIPKKPARRLPPDLRNHRGGVSPRMHAPAIRGARTKRQKGKKQAGKFPNFTYQGGPVIASPQVYTSFWGALWSDALHQARALRLNQFHRDLLASGFMNVLSQYGVGNGAGNSGAFVGDSLISDTPETLTDPTIQATIQSAIDRGVIPEPAAPSNIALIIYLDENSGVNDPSDQLVLCEPQNDSAFGYHNFFTTTAGHKFYYAVIPGLTDMCLKESCAQDSGCSLHLAETQEQRQTQVASHEFAEMTTDPELNAWLDPQAGENGDICNGESATISIGGNSWTVQRTYSKTDDMATGGQSYCVATAPAPIPPLKPGP
ncbi:MAG TPA: hypothetical protein VFQ24_06380 [Terriglobia bacterium]|nr:hypothetical protein [Terriglobia bacterium]